MNISVVVPIYNAEKWLDLSIKSILGQTLPAFQIILIDDGSTDSSRLICEEWSKTHSSIEVIHQKNAGVGAARNAGLQIASGDWIAFVDPDDRLEPWLFERLAAEVDDDTDIVACCCKLMADDKIIGIDHFFDGSREFDSDKLDLVLQLMDKQYCHPGTAYTAIGVPWGKLYRRSMLNNQCILFDETLIRMQDNIFNGYAFMASRKVKYIDEAGYLYRTEHFDKHRWNLKRDWANNIVRVLDARQRFAERYMTELPINTQLKVERARSFLQIVNEYAMPMVDRAQRKNELDRFTRIFSPDMLWANNHYHLFSIVQRIELGLLVQHKYRLYHLCWHLKRIMCSD